MILLPTIFLLFILSLTAESILHTRNLRRIPLRITVSGTRGKSTVVRLLASVMREAGYRVLAKTTGSEPRLVMPDGSEEPVKRRGRITILEQKGLVRRAASIRADCLVCEIMSIRPENHRAETRQLLKPHFTILTNFRPDHLNVTGSLIKEISSLHGNDIFPESRVMIPACEINEYIRMEIESSKGHLLISQEDNLHLLGLPDQVTANHHPANLSLVIAAARELRIPEDTIRIGILKARLDIGRPRIFRFEGSLGPVFFVNAFAANDPLSTLQLMDRVIKELALPNPTINALISLRSDRAERSRQWLNWLTGEGANMYRQVYAIGAHARLFERKLANCTRVLSDQLPVTSDQTDIAQSQSPFTIHHSPFTNHWSLVTGNSLTHRLLLNSPPNTILFGIANIAGAGKALVECWSQGGFEYNPIDI